MRDQPQTISLKDLYIASFLKTKGFQLHNAVLDNVGRTTFIFKTTPELNEALTSYYTGTAAVSPSTFIENFKSLRALTYSLSGDLKKKI